MKRAPALLASSAAGLAVVLGLHAAGSAPTVSGPPVGTASGTAPSSTSRSPSSTSTPTDRSRAILSAVGTTEQYGYGTLAVKVLTKGHHIEDVTVVQLQTAESYSQSLAQHVIPILRGEVLAAQSVHVNGVSGATYTSEAYLSSLQTALDHLHV